MEKGKYAIIIVLLLISLFIVDYLNFKNTQKNVISGIIGSEIPAPHLNTKIGYVPFVWEGDFRFVKLYADGTKENFRNIYSLIMQIGETPPFQVPIENGYGNGYIPYEDHNEPIEIYISFVPSKYYLKDHYTCEGILFIIAQTKEHTWITKRKVRLYWSCSGFWYGGWTR